MSSNMHTYTFTVFLCSSETCTLYTSTILCVAQQHLLHFASQMFRNFLSMQFMNMFNLLSKQFMNMFNFLVSSPFRKLIYQRILFSNSTHYLPHFTVHITCIFHLHSFPTSICRLLTNVRLPFTDYTSGIALSICCAIQCRKIQHNTASTAVEDFQQSCFLNLTEVK